MADIEFQGAGGILEGDIEDVNINVNQDAVLEFNGSSDYITVDDHSSLDITDAITVSAWVKTSVRGDGIIYKEANANLGPFAIHTTGANGYLKGYFPALTENRCTASNQLVSALRWTPAPSRTAYFKG